MLTSFGFDLNNREIATLFYLVVIVVVVFLWEQGRSLALNVVRAFFAPKLVTIWLLMTFYVGACVWLLVQLNIWEWMNLKSTLVWWLTVGCMGTFKAQQLKDNSQAFRKLLRETFTFTAVILFVTELVSLSIFSELLIIPVLIFLNGLIVFSGYKTDQPDVIKLSKVLQSFQVLVGLFLISYSYWQVISNIGEHWSINTLREFVLPFLLWIMFIPFIYLLAFYMTYEEVFVRLQIRPEQAPIVGYARWRALFSFGLSIDGVKRLARALGEHNVTDKVGVKETIREIKRLLKNEKNSPTVTFDEGWSPYEARLFLEKYGLVTDDYRRMQWGWFAQSALVKLNDKVPANRASYTILGNSKAVTQLSFSLDASKLHEIDEVRSIFDEISLTLITKAFSLEEARIIYGSSSRSELLVFNDIKISQERSDWGDIQYGGFELRLTIEHPTHMLAAFESVL